MFQLFSIPELWRYLLEPQYQHYIYMVLILSSFNSLQFQLRFINFLFLFLFFRFMIFVWFFKTCHFEKYQHAFWWTLSIKTINLLNQLKKLVVPGAPPRNITADATSPTTIAVSWLPPPSDRANGRIVYYKGI